MSSLGRQLSLSLSPFGFVFVCTLSSDYKTSLLAELVSSRSSSLCVAVFFSETPQASFFCRLLKRLVLLHCQYHSMFHTIETHHSAISSSSSQVVDAPRMTNIHRASAQVLGNPWRLERRLFLFNHIKIDVCHEGRARVLLPFSRGHHLLFASEAPALKFMSRLVCVMRRPLLLSFHELLTRPKQCFIAH